MPNDPSHKTAAAAPQINKGTATFADNVLTLAGGTTIALAVTIVASPITSRLFGPEAFGLATVFRSCATALAAIACLRYEMAIVLPKKDEDAAQLFALCCMSLMAMTTLTVILTYAIGARLLIYLNAVELAPILWLLPVNVFLLGSQLPLIFWFTRQKQFRTNATGTVISSFPIAAAEIIGGSAGYRAGENLVVFRVFGLTFAPVYLFGRLLRGQARFILRNVNSSEIYRLAKTYIKFPVFETVSILLNVLSFYAPILLLTPFFSTAVCGFYAKAIFLMALPSIILGRSVGQVFLQESAAARGARRNIAGLFETVFNRMITIGTLPFAIIAIIGPELFNLFLGTRWTESGVYAQILSPAFFLGFLVGSIRSLFGTLGRQELDFISNVLLLLMRVAILILGGLMLRDVRLTLLIYMVAIVLIRLWRISFLIRATKASAKRPIFHFWRCLAYVVPSVVPIAVMKWWFCLEAIYLVALTPIFSITYIALVLKNDIELRNICTKYYQRVFAFRR